MAKQKNSRQADALDQLAFEPEAPKSMGRTAGFCLECHKLVERGADGSCPEGHHAAGVVGVVKLSDDFDKELPQLTNFNGGAFFAPMVWGPVYGMWAGLLMFPLWMFVDNVLFTAVVRGGWWWAGGLAVLAITVLLMAWFARTATIPAYLKLKHPISIEKFNRQQRVWSVVGFIFLLVILGLATAYNLMYRLPEMGL